MRRISGFALLALLIVVVALLVSGIDAPRARSSPFAQVEPTHDPTVEARRQEWLDLLGENPFRVEGEIGRALPRRIVYDPVGEQFAVVDAYNTLVLMDAHTYDTRHTLYDDGVVLDMKFSHDGRYLAVINDLTVELWDTNTGTLVASLTEPGNPKRLFGPVAFSSQDEVLIFYGVYAAPPALRRTENDTVTYPWVWHLPAARGESASTLPNGNVAHINYDYRSGFVLTPEDRIVTALPSRLRILDALTLDTISEIETQSYGDDALTVWMSVYDGAIYVASFGELLRVDALNGTLIEPKDVETPITRELPPSDLWNAVLSVSLATNLQALQLIDIVQPLDVNTGSARALLYGTWTTDSGTRSNSFLGDIRDNQISQMAVSPDGMTLLTREVHGNEVIVAYDLESGDELDMLIPSLRSPVGYNRSAQNRVLAYDAAGETFLSDFQRYDAESFDVLAEDLRYSFQFERFFFGREPNTMVTISGTEWRLWDVSTNTVIRREIMANPSGAIRSITSDGYRILSDVQDGVFVQDFGTDETYTIRTPNIPDTGLSLTDTYLNPSWTRLLSVYSDSRSGMYSPGIALAVTEGNSREPVWLIAGDDLPSGNGQIGWLDENTVYIGGVRGGDTIPSRVYGVDYAPSGLPACLEARFPMQRDALTWLWERKLYYTRSDRLHQLALNLCESSLPARDIMATLAVTPTFTPSFFTAVPATPDFRSAGNAGEPPPCLVDYVGENSEYLTLWAELAAAVPPEGQSELAALLCEGIAEEISHGVTRSGGSSGAQTMMFIDADTGLRSSGVLPPTPTPIDASAVIPFRNPVDLIAPAFASITRRPLGQALMSEDRQLLAVSNLPGELTIYRLDFPYGRAGVPLTATAEYVRTQQNMIYPGISPTPPPSNTPDIIGTPRPTLTITPSQTVLPLPENELPAQNVQVCPNNLYPINSPPPNYAATGRIYGTFGDSGIWGIEPEDGRRFADVEAPACGFGLNCQFSPDRAWILAQTFELVYVVRPDNSDQRVLWDLRTPNPATPFPNNLRWGAPDMLEWDGNLVIATPGATPTIIPIIARDVLNVFPDPNVLPRNPNIMINGIRPEIVSRQPGCEWLVAQITYGTGTGTGYRYYLYHLGTGETIFFLQHPRYSGTFEWHPYGDRLYFYLNMPNMTTPNRYEVVFPDAEMRHTNRASYASRGWSPDGTRAAQIYTTQTRHLIYVNDIENQVVNQFCLPDVEDIPSRLYWSPDSRYIAFVAEITDDEEEHLLVLDTETGYTVDLTRGIFSIVTWGQEPGTYGSGAVMTPTPTPVFFPTPTPGGGS